MINKSKNYLTVTKNQIFKNRLVYFMVFLVIALGAVSSVSAAQSAVNLGTAGNFVILSKSGISTTGTTSIVGDIGVSPIASTAITGFGLIMDPSNQFATSSLVIGNIYASDYAVPTPTTMTTAISDMATAYTDAAGRTIPDFTELGAGNIDGMTLTPGLYKWGTGVGFTNGITISGGTNDIWIFQISGDLTVGNGAIVTLSNGAQAKNIFWQVAGGTGVAIGTTAHVEGNILAVAAITLGTSASLNGRALAQTAVTLDSNAVVLPTAAPLPTSPFSVCSSGCDFSVIQAAINFATAGDTINISSGTYNESISINKSLNLVGVGVSKPVITGSANYSYILEVNGTTGVVIDNLEINGGSTNTFSYGVLVNNAGTIGSPIELKNSTVKNINGKGIGVETSSYLLVHDNEISFSDSGIVITSELVSVDNSFANITYNNLHDLNWAINFEKLTGSANIHNNKFANISKAINAENSIGIISPGPTIDAGNNWLGTAVESEIQNLVYSEVDYSPWYTTVEMVSLNGLGTLNVTSDGTNLTLTQDVVLSNSANNVVATILTGTTVSGNSSWNGMMNNPAIQLTANVTPIAQTGFTTSVSKVIEIGVLGAKLTFDKAVKMTVPGEAGKKVGYSYDGITFNNISSVCLDNTQATNDLLPAGGDCYFNDGTILTIWTKHFTQFVTYNQTPIQSPVNLGTAGNFIVLATSGISTTGTTSIVGDIGVSPIDSTAITGFGLIMDSTNQFATSSLVTGKVYASDYAVPTPTTMTTAISDMGTAYNDAAGRTIPDYTELGAGNIGGLTLTPGLYKWTTGVTIPSDVTISGSSTDVWIFQIAGTLGISPAKKVILSGGAQASNIFWQVAGQATLGTTSVFEGIILSQTAIVIDTGATLNGRALAQTAVTLDSNAVSLTIVAPPVVPITSSGGSGGGGGGGSSYTRSAESNSEATIENSNPIGFSYPDCNTNAECRTGETCEEVEGGYYSLCTSKAQSTIPTTSSAEPIGAAITGNIVMNTLKSSVGKVGKAVWVGIGIVLVILLGYNIIYRKNN